MWHHPIPHAAFFFFTTASPSVGFQPLTGAYTRTKRYEKDTILWILKGEISRNDRELKFFENVFKTWKDLPDEHAFLPALCNIGLACTYPVKAQWLKTPPIKLIYQKIGFIHPLNWHMTYLVETPCFFKEPAIFSSKLISKLARSLPRQTLLST